jgi:DNA-nicking Smr family endonuclease
MSDDSRHRRGLSAIEHELWSRVTRSVVPLARMRKRKRAPVADLSERPPKPAPAPPHRPSLPERPVVRRHKPPEPALVPLERRFRQRLARGGARIDARLDLHGRTQEEARAALLRFLKRAQSEGARLVLVITGKGIRAHAGERGVLRRQVPMWLALPELRGYVIGFEDAHIGHGGEGALYVRVRRA